MHVLRSRWPLIALSLLIFLAAGAVFAGLATPTYRSTAVIDGAEQTLTDATSPKVVAAFRAKIAQKYDQAFALSVDIGARADGALIELYADAEFADVAADVVDTYARVLIDQSPSTLESEASFPGAPRSPNLFRIALLTGLGGLLAGTLLARLLPRWRSHIDELQPTTATATVGLATAVPELSRTAPLWLAPTSSSEPFDLSDMESVGTDVSERTDLAAPGWAEPIDLTSAEPDQRSRREKTEPRSFPPAPRITIDLREQKRTLAAGRRTDMMPRVVHLPPGD